ncbi:4'-phosphopantetheinyl transferase superfamily protein [Ensifer sp. ENS09]|uniref:4'-phosphopantetheinyl transferase family protein n=1 Tax=Ensifer sp. ENS09 TaxID=2769263 RepID=UPI00177F08AD|nr:4'-phosphopantetheinyl transferase superfamily protein [Ensifer sp. ENS09]MBD9653134.1 4'-phosphopantetheinyl transferase superfamily protein [Ensifer sp. ENS09]
MLNTLSSLFGPGVAAATSDPTQPADGLHPPEVAFVANAVDQRRREFAAGRRCARAAMQTLGIPQQTVAAGTDRAPVWPNGIVGSITHCDSLCGAVVARKADGFRSLGLDIEPAKSLDSHLVELICNSQEIAWLNMFCRDNQGLMARAVFSAKEAVYKAQYALSGVMLDFHALSIRLAVMESSFVATFHVLANPFLIGDRIHGRIAIDGGYIATAVILKALPNQHVDQIACARVHSPIGAANGGYCRSLGRIRI